MICITFVLSFWKSWRRNVGQELHKLPKKVISNVDLKQSHFRSSRNFVLSTFTIKLDSQEPIKRCRTKKVWHLFDQKTRPGWPCWCWENRIESWEQAGSDIQCRRNQDKGRTDGGGGARRQEQEASLDREEGNLERQNVRKDGFGLTCPWGQERKHQMWQSSP